ncbi:MAG: polysulfide reductase NrfD [Candidatus Rokubacteria bacterium]|nr:polysulfide reductase NrfD [Candidatus Rokubacteria bacterium]
MPTVTGHDRLLADLGATFRPQRRWVEGRGVLLIAGHFLSGVAAGTWLFSLWLGVGAGLTLAVVAMAMSGVAHLFFLGHPERFWRMVRARRSWIARGFLGMTLFMAGAVPALVLRPGALRSAALALAIAGAAIVIVYKGNVYAASKGIPFWNSPVLPVLYATYAIRGGLAVLLVILPFSAGSAETRWMELLELWVAVSAAVMLGFYLGVMRNTSVAARRSVGELTGGRAALAFYLGTVGAGLVVPILVGIAGLAGPTPGLVLACTGAFSLAGDFFAKYAIARAGIYVPMMPAGRI